MFRIFSPALRSVRYTDTTARPRESTWNGTRRASSKARGQRLKPTARWTIERARRVSTTIDIDNLTALTSLWQPPVNVNRDTCQTWRFNTNCQFCMTPEKLILYIRRNHPLHLVIVLNYSSLSKDLYEIF